jgi:AcrR family transcriptional regulator
MPSRKEQKEATRAHLYNVAMALFAERGYPAVNIDEIVRASGVARGTFYFHFPTKEDILFEAVRLGEKLIVAKMDAVGPERPFRDALIATCDGFAEAWAHRRNLLVEAGAVGIRRMVSSPELRDEEPLRRGLVGHVERALASGSLKSMLPAQMLADVFLLDVFAALMSWAPHGTPGLDVVMPGVIDLFLRGAEGFGTSRADSPAAAPSPAAPPRRPARSPAPPRRSPPRR